ncbi:MAG: signal peptidase I [Candidatus Methylomirabilales bacterium]
MDDHKKPVVVREETEASELSAGSPLAARVRQKSAAREWIEAFVVAVLLALFIRTFVVQAFKIPSGSMLETLQIGDHILVNKMSYGIQIPILEVWVLGPWVPERGDIIVFKFPQDESRDFIKRTIGLPGDRIEIRGKDVLINGELSKEPYVRHGDPMLQASPQSPRDFFGPVTVPPGKLFVMGDNRDHSQDSRFWGFLDIQKVEGKAFLIYWSWDGEVYRPRWHRIGRWID